jgi:hypothetical protein
MPERTPTTPEAGWGAEEAAMIDLTALTPAERARQLGHPDGETGLAIAESLNSIIDPALIVLP